MGCGKSLHIHSGTIHFLPYNLCHKIFFAKHFRKVKMIYIDPPYNTGNDFVYADDFADPLARYREVTAQTTKGAGPPRPGGPLLCQPQALRLALPLEAVLFKIVVDVLPAQPQPVF